MSEVVENVEELRSAESGAVAQPVGQPPPPPLQQVLLPADGRNMAEFAAEIGGVIGPKRQWYVNGEQVVDVREVKMTKDLESHVFHSLHSAEVISAVEDHLLVGRESTKDGTPTFVKRSMGRETATALLASPQFKRALPRIERILDVPIPYLIEGALVFAKCGHDERFNTFCPARALTITPFKLQDSKKWLRELLNDFCFANKVSATLAIARLITPMCRGLMGHSARPPVFIFEANRPRAGKDYLAGCTSVLYEGRANEDAPLDTESEETGKRITAALCSGRRFMHFANCKGHIDNAAFEHASTAKVYSSRRLGSNDASADVVLPNELEFSISANTGFSFTEDFNLRCRKISLHYAQEDANSRTFNHPDLHRWIKEHRLDLLNSLAGLIAHWHEKGRPKGPTPFTSFPEWAEVVGGILVTCELGDPCIAQLDGAMTGDPSTEDMKRLFEVGFRQHGTRWITKNDLHQLVRCPEEDLFSWLDLNDRSGQTAFGLKLRQFKGRCLGGIYLQMDNPDARRPRFCFTQDIPKNEENMTLAVLGANQEENCQPWQPCQPLSPDGATEMDIHPMCCRGINVAKVAEVATLVDEAVPLAVPRDGNLRRDENGCPLPPVGLGELVALNLPGLDLRTRLKRVLDSRDLFTHPITTPSTNGALPCYSAHWEL